VAVLNVRWEMLAAPRTDMGGTDCRLPYACVPDGRATDAAANANNASLADQILDPASASK